MRHQWIEHTLPFHLVQASESNPFSHPIYTLLSKQRRKFFFFMTQGIRVKKFCYHYLLPIIQLSGCCDIHNPFGVCIYNFQAETESRPNFVLIRTTFRKKKCWPFLFVTFRRFYLISLGWEVDRGAILRDFESFIWFWVSPRLVNILCFQFIL